jgi:hypothetical protein
MPKSFISQVVGTLERRGKSEGIKIAVCLQQGRSINLDAYRSLTMLDISVFTRPTRVGILHSIEKHG